MNLVVYNFDINTQTSQHHFQIVFWSPLYALSSSALSFHAILKLCFTIILKSLVLWLNLKFTVVKLVESV